MCDIIDGDERWLTCDVNRYWPWPVTATNLTAAVAGIVWRKEEQEGDWLTWLAI